ncbi:hypothetical protein J1N35_011219 [Gossypium stocksii]|uniref:Uncharacterized protein n=1 Tax=Gossypium stocksii TaxID=47602 RepID=A0A9D3W1Z4_9ROSI|nr:hypothetical protein J1N35_011219 [Gossypium stocksii]
MLMLHSIMQAVAQEAGEAQLIETDPATIEKETKEPQEEIKKTKSVNFATDSEEEEEANPTPAPPVDSTVVD